MLQGYIGIYNTDNTNVGLCMKSILMSDPVSGQMAKALSGKDNSR